MRRSLLVLFIIIIFAACSSQKAENIGEGQPPAQTVSGTGQPAATTVPAAVTDAEKPRIVLKPDDATTQSILYLELYGFVAGDATFEWLINSGLPFPGESTSQLKPGIAKKGSVVSARATVKGVQVSSNSVRIKNAAPSIARIKWTPEVFKAGDLLGIEVTGTDPDSDNVTFQYEWTKNGEPAGQGRTINAPVKRGDKVSVTVTPSDGELSGKPMTFKNEIRNTPPVIIDSKKLKFDGTMLVQQVEATDADGDPITYSLQNAPEGMTINPSTGLITWTVPASFKGKGSYTVVARDNYKGEASQLFNFDIGE